MNIVLGDNRYGKAENRVVRVTREKDTHHILDLNVSVQ
jgi:urate oxidase